MAKNNRICGICKKSYRYCPSCMADAHKPTWMAVFCSENCKAIYDVLDECRYHSLSKKDAYEKLNTLDLSRTDTLPEYFKETLNEILEEGKDVKEPVFNVIFEEPIEEIIVEDTVEAPIEEFVVVAESVETTSIEEETNIEETDVSEEVIEIKKPRKRKAKVVE